MKISHFQGCDVPPPKKGAIQKTSGGGTLNAVTQDECIPFALDSEDHPPNDSDVVHVPVKFHSKLNLRGNKLIIIICNFTR